MAFAHRFRLAAIAGAIVLASVPAGAQVYSDGYKFLEAVEKKDRRTATGDKAIDLGPGCRNHPSIETLEHILILQVCGLIRICGITMHFRIPPARTLAR